MSGCGVRGRDSTGARRMRSVIVRFSVLGFDSAISEVVNYAKRVDTWMRDGGRAEIARHLRIKSAA